MGEYPAGWSRQEAGNALAAAHAQLGAALAQRYLGRVAPKRMLHLYCAALGVSERDSQWLQAHVLRTGLQRRHEQQIREARHGVLRFRDWLRVTAAPDGNAPLTRVIERDLARCRELVHRLEARLEGGRAGTVTPHRPGRRTWRPTRPDATASQWHDGQLAAASDAALIAATGTRR